MRRLTAAEARLWAVAHMGEGIVEVKTTLREAVLAAGFATRYQRERDADGVYHYTTEEGSEAYIGRLGVMVPRFASDAQKNECDCGWCRQGLTLLCSRAHP